MITPNSFNSIAEFDQGRTYIPTHYFVYDGKYIGSVDVHEMGGCRTLWALSIKEEYRNQGYGQLMMLELMAYFADQPIYLYVEDSNYIAKHLYQSVGFKVCGRHYWSAADHMKWSREDV